MTREPSPPVSKPPTGIDWSSVYRHLETFQTALAHGVMSTPEEKQKILRARAQALAREPEAEEAARRTLEVVEFLLAYETYGIESSYVREVYPLKAFTPLPCTPPFVLGIINIRGLWATFGDDFLHSHPARIIIERRCFLISQWRLWFP